MTGTTALLDALALGGGGTVALVGAGGKTTLAYRLATEAQAVGLRVIVTTTTHMGPLAPDLTGPLIMAGEGGVCSTAGGVSAVEGGCPRPPGDVSAVEGDVHSELAQALERWGRATVLGSRVRSDKLRGLDPGRVDELAGEADLVVVEADGARGRSLKLPASHEPVVPESTSLLLVLAGIDALGCPLDGEVVHRLELVAEAVGARPGSPIDEELMLAALTHARGYPSRRPSSARLGVFLNKTEGASRLAAAQRLAQRLRPPYDCVVAGSARGGALSVWT